MKESINHLSVSLFKDKQKTVEKAIDKLKDMREVGQIKAFSEIGRASCRERV